MASSLLILILSTIAISNEVASTLIGEQANIDEYGYAASIYHYGSFQCSGAIINERYILTAGHCVCGMTATSFKVIVGVDRVTDANKAKWLDVAAVHCSYGFGKASGTSVDEHDMGLIKLKNPLVLSCKIRSIRLSFDTGSYVRAGCKLVLFRENDKYLDSNPQTSVHNMDLSLRYVIVKVPLREGCLPWTRLLVNEICALNAYPTNQDYRPGDSGAPVVCGGKVFAVLVRGLGEPDVKGAAILQVVHYQLWIAKIVNGPQ